MAPGTASSAKAGQKSPVAATTAAARSGPAKAPIWSIALCTPNPLPRPTWDAAEASSTDFDGLRRALPVRSARISTTANARPTAPRCGASASSGTQTAVIPYPRITSGQCRCVRSAIGPATRRRTRAIASPAPVTMPTVRAEAPRDPRNGPDRARMAS